MKTKFFIAALAALLLGTAAQASELGDTIRTYQYNFPQKVHTVIAKGYSKVVIVPDSVEYLVPADPFRTQLGSFDVSKSDAKDGKVIINSPAGTGTLLLHLIMEGSLTVTATDYSNITLGKPDKENGFLRALQLYANRYGHITVPRIDTGADTMLTTTNFIARASEYSEIHVEAPLAANSIRLNAVGFSKIIIDYCAGDNLKSNETVTSHVEVRSHNVKQTEFKYVSKYPKRGHDEEEEEVSEEDYIVLDDVDNIRSRHLSHKAHNPKRNEFNIRFLWGFNNWGTDHFNGLTGMMGAYDLHTSFSSYQLEMMYYPYVRNQFRIGLGLGYESDVYKFSNNYVQIIPDGGLSTFSIGTPNDDMRTRLVARYVTLPITMQWHHDEFMLGLSAIPGLTVGDKYKVIYGKGSANDISSKSNLLNPYKFDARFTIGWQNLYAFLQVPVLTLNKDMVMDLYPIKFGFAINLGD